jgi:restriction system protein
MSLWLVRAGKYGQYEPKFFDTSRVYATWDGLQRDLAAPKHKPALREVLQDLYPDWGRQRTINYSGQLWSFAREMKVGDWVVLPLKNKPAIAIGEITGNYKYDAKAEDPYFHSRTVKWLATDVPRSSFDQDLLYSFGAFMTICEVTRNDAEQRVRAMARRGWKGNGGTVDPAPVSGEDSDVVDLEQLAKDQIAKALIARFKGHGMARIVDAILTAQGYTTFLSPEGPDKGVDILAAPGPLGFGRPRICVQVKSGDTPADHSVLTQLIGAMQAVQADQGLLVSWSGFKVTVDRERAAQFFRVRLWDQQDLITALLAEYGNFDQDLRAELPLKRMWVVAQGSDV